VTPPNDPQALAESLRVLAEDNQAYEANVEAFQDLFESLQTWADVAGKVLEVYREIGVDLGGASSGEGPGSPMTAARSAPRDRRIVEAAQP
jgi:hypothetical protein